MSALLPNQFKVLCIEDEPEILGDIVDELRDHGFQVEMAANAEKALPIIESQSPHLIVCDMQMPGMSGLELLESIRARTDGLASIPFVFLTAFGDRQTMINGRRAGADDYLVKPVDYDLLIAAVESHLQNTARRTERAAVVPDLLADQAANVQGRAELLEYVDTLPDGMTVAIAKFDNLGELSRRFDHAEASHILKLARRISSIANIRTFWINTHTCAVTGSDPAKVDLALARMARFTLRDRDAPDLPEIPMSMSIVSCKVVKSQPFAKQLDYLLESALLLQREGGGQALKVDGPELSELRIASSIRAELVNAIKQGQLHVCFQPKVRSACGTPVAAEVLVRWESPLLGQLSPATFIPVVERAGLLPHVTDWVLHQAAKSQVRLLGEGLPARLAVNIGASEFNPDLPGRIATIFAEHGADLKLVEVEITETSLIDDPRAADQIVKALHNCGIVVALDDFGTGFSSLSHLQTCTVDAIKIDRSFVSQVAEDGQDRKIVLGIIRLAEMLGLETIAEGVELEAQRQWLQDFGCNILQGYLISRPLRLDNYREFLRNRPEQR